jgi:hypothetical protein
VVGNLQLVLVDESASPLGVTGLELEFERSCLEVRPQLLSVIAVDRSLSGSSTGGRTGGRTSGRHFGVESGECWTVKEKREVVVDRCGRL